jgi:hypothetical protein
VSALRVVAAVAAALAAAPAASYERTRGTAGVPLAWREPVVAWHLNRSWPKTSPSCEATAAGDPTLAAVQASFAAWEQPCANLQLVYAGTTPEIRVGTVGSSENLVVFREGWCSELLSPNEPCYLDPEIDCGGIFNCFEDHECSPGEGCANKSVVALTSVLYDPANGRIFDADIEINGWDGHAGAIATSQPPHGWYFTCHDTQPGADCTTYGEAGCTFIDLRNTVTHEVGHFAGLAHPCGASEGRRDCDLEPTDGVVPYLERTMSPTTGPGEILKRSLSADDVAGVCAIYPDDGGGCGCGSAGAGGTLGLLLAAVALRRPRSRRANAD